MDTKARPDTTPPEEPDGPGDYFTVESRWGQDFVVSPSTVKHIEQAIEAGTRWVRFIDLHGNVVLAQTNNITLMYQSTAESRHAQRKFQHLIRKEYKANRNWEDDD